MQWKTGTDDQGMYDRPDAERIRMERVGQDAHVLALRAVMKDGDALARRVLSQASVVR
jgi:hypothetical protein